MSVSAWLVTSFALRPSRVSFFHQIDSATTQPGRARSVTRACNSKLPRSLNTRTRAPSVIPRAAASTGWISSAGSPSASRSDATLTNVEFRKLRAGGEMMASGKRRARSGLLDALSYGAT